MLTVADAVKEIIGQTPFLEEALARRLINLSSLARTIRRDVETKTFKKVKIGSIIMALKRLSLKLKPNKNLRLVFKSSPDLIVRSNLFELTIRNSTEFITNQRKILNYTTKKDSSFATITHGVFETTIIASQEVKDKIRQICRHEKIISKFDNLSSITVRFSKEIIDTPGVFYTVIKNLFWENISLVEIVSTYSELTVILEDTQVDKAFAVIKKLFN